MTSPPYLPLTVKNRGKGQFCDCPRLWKYVKAMNSVLHSSAVNDKRLARFLPLFPAFASRR